tara:strand:- start:1372 stop:1836 length:465 start_codon:yes stop_codon:yes gene_type:complete
MKRSIDEYKKIISEFFENKSVKFTMNFALFAGMNKNDIVEAVRDGTDDDEKKKKLVEWCADTYGRPIYQYLIQIIGRAGLEEYVYKGQTRGKISTQRLLDIFNEVMPSGYSALRPGDKHFGGGKRKKRTRKSKRRKSKSRKSKKKKSKTRRRRR